MNAADMAATPQRPSALARYEDWPDYAVRHRYEAASPAAQHLADTLGVPAGTPDLEYTAHSETVREGVTTSRLSWQVGFGPRTSAWFVRPSGESGPLPGLLALHCHGGVKAYGAERLVSLPDQEEHHDAGSSTAGGSGQEPHPFGPIPPDVRKKLYDGRAPATWLAQQGFAVLAHDTFMWGSRGFGMDPLPWRTASAVDGQRALWREAGVEPSAAELYNAAAAAHEETVAKAATLLGSSVAGTVAHDDLAALGILATLPGVDSGRLGCLGFSGGGGRAMVLAALSPLVRSYVVTCMMTTFSSLLPAYLDAHSWLLHSPGLARLGDWPDLAVRSTAEAVLVQYALKDPLFPEQGMRDAHRYLVEHAATRYTGSFWQEPHVFTRAMQEEAAAFLSAALHPLQTLASPAPDLARTDS
ncbi:dienelactone hydrolase [Paenarthrobacter nitroguajacolicus]|uniref:dienelactone hydrolase family protein n=1 Tax=Paenarthrobacter nitroguajacolicus TaxID=211146 RepID=UPI0028665559|nr:dienelactone hydrolase family protein [Paenarthrobacter nitroguajacolicus]MDR6988078.1 dienelactone hydrolase [Paenarthrobacter nitroguajacolicus]